MEYKQDQIYRIGKSEEDCRIFFDNFNKSIFSCCDGNPSEIYLNLNRTIIRLVICDESFIQSIKFCLECSIVEPRPYKYSIVLWKTDRDKLSHQGTSYIQFEHQGRFSNIMTFLDNGMVRGFDKSTNTFYCGFPYTSKDFHPLVIKFNKILNENNLMMVHGACVGIDGKGVLICGKGGMGKSTLAVSALLKGFEYVADDYMILDWDGSTIKASPVYSTAHLTYRMYDKMREDLVNVIPIDSGPERSKYVLNISAFHNSFRWNYPVRLCLKPQIVPGLSKPVISKCTEEEKGAAIVHIVYSTVSQLSTGRDNAYNLKLLQMFRSQIFYKISLCSDVQANVECLRSFLKSL